MTSRLAGLLQGGVPEPQRLLDPDLVSSAARHRRTWRRGAASMATVLAVTAALAVPVVLSHHDEGIRPGPSSRAVVTKPGPLAVDPPATPTRAVTPSSTATASAAPSRVGADPSSQTSLAPEGPIIAWDAGISFGTVVSVDQLLAFRGLAFKPVVPGFSVPPTRIDASRDRKSGYVGGQVKLHYTFRSADFPVDGRVVVYEQSVASAVGVLADVARGKVPASAGTSVRVAGHLSLLTKSNYPPDGQESFTIVTVRGNALIIIAGPALPRAQALKLAAEL